MGATTTASSTDDIRYAPEDPSLPKPWRGLVDGNTGYVYFWNPETNITQYEKPAPPLSSSIPSSKYLSSSVHKSLHGRCDGNDRGDNNSMDFKTLPDYSQDDPNPKINGGHRAYNLNGFNDTVLGDSYFHQHEITVTGNQVPQPFTTFEATGFPSEILKEVHCAGFSAPTPIQAQSWPIALQGRDVVAIAKTGSGKTLGYLIPGFIHLKKLRNNPRLGPTVLVLSPTRELANQIQDEAMKFGTSSKISCTCLYGGAPKGPQLRDLDRGMDVVVATPGRLNDILEMKKVSLHQVSYLVLDEADRMLDMGFEPQIRKIVKEVPSCRQTLMYTATWPREVRRIASDLLANPVQISIGSVDKITANKAILQHVEVLPPLDKRRRLEQILRSQEPGSRIIIFCSTKKSCDQLAGNLSHHFSAAAIHGDKSQTERDYVLSQFRTGRTPVLVATDVAARGLDIKDIRVVINYDFPTGIEEYVHRIGRTGRAGATGVAYTFFGEQDAKHAANLAKILEGANQRVPVEVLDMVSSGREGKGKHLRASGSTRTDRGRVVHASYSVHSGKPIGRVGWGMSSSTDDQVSRAQNLETCDRLEMVNAKIRGRSRSRSRDPNKKSDRYGRSRSKERFGGTAFTASNRHNFHKHSKFNTRTSRSINKNYHGNVEREIKSYSSHAYN